MAMDYKALAIRLAQEAAPSPHAKPAQGPCAAHYPLRTSDGVIQRVNDRTLLAIETPEVLERDARGDAVAWKAAAQTYEIAAGDDLSSSLLARRCVWAMESGVRVRLTWFGINGTKILRDFEVLADEPV